MKLHRIPFVLAGLTLFTAVFVYSEEAVDLSVIHRIKAEAFENSKVMDHEFYLTDVHGPRLAGSPGYRAAGEPGMALRGADHREIQALRDVRACQPSSVPVRKQEGLRPGITQSLYPVPQ